MDRALHSSAEAMLLATHESYTVQLTAHSWTGRQPQQSAQSRIRQMHFNHDIPATTYNTLLYDF